MESSHLQMDDPEIAAYCYPVVESPSSSTIELRLQGDTSAMRMLSFATSNYLGLGQRAEVKQAAVDAVARYGLGANSSPILTGQFDVHERLSSGLRELTGQQDVLLFSSGVSANIGAVAALVEPGDAVLLDDYAHGSLLVGAQLSGAEIRRYRHCDYEELAWLLKRFSGSGRRVLLPMVGIFSMTGEIEDVPAVVELARRHRAITLLDDAHALGVIGARGRGSLEHHGLPQSAVDIHMGTLSKTLAGMGGYLAAPEEILRTIRATAKTHILSAGIAPCVAAGCSESLRILLDEGSSLSERLRTNAKLMRMLFRERGAEVLGDGTAVIPVLLQHERNLPSVMRFCMEAGVFGNPVVFPGVPKGTGRLRLTVVANHTEDELRYAADVILTALRVDA